MSYYGSGAYGDSLYGYDNNAGGQWQPVSTPGSTGIQPGSAMGQVMYNPGQIDLGQQNPALYAELQRMRGIRSGLDPLMQQYLDPNLRGAQEADMRKRADTALTNRYAQMGLGASSVGMNARDEQARQFDLTQPDRQMGYALKALQLNNSLTQGITSDIQGIQGGFESYQNDYINAILGKQANDDANSRALVSGAGGLLGGLAGFLAGGPGGAAVGAGLGSKLGIDVQGLNMSATADPTLSGMPGSADPYANSPAYSDPTMSNPYANPYMMSGNGMTGQMDTGYNPYF